MFDLDNAMLAVAACSIIYVTGFSIIFYKTIWRELNLPDLNPEKLLGLRMGALTLFAQLIGGAIALPAFFWTMTKDQRTLASDEASNADKAFAEALTLEQSPNDSAVFTGFISLERIAKSNPGYWPSALSLAQFLLKQSRFPAKAPSGDPYIPITGGAQGAFDLIAQHVVSTGRSVASNSACRAYANNPDIVDLNSAYLAGARAFGSTGLAGAYLEGTKLFGADFRQANLTCAHFAGAKADDWLAYGYGKDKDGKARWPDNSMAHSPDWLNWQRYQFIANFTDANLAHANFHNAGLAGAIFQGSDVQGADFSGANLSRADFRGAKHVAQANFEHACQNDPPEFDSAFVPKIGVCK